MNRLKTHEEDIETAGKHDTIRGNRAKSTGKCWKNTVKENVITTWQENVITTRIKGAKSVGTWRKPGATARNKL